MPLVGVLALVVYSTPTSGNHIISGFERNGNT